MLISQYDRDMILKKNSLTDRSLYIIIKTSIIDDRLVASLGYFQQWVWPNFFSTTLFFAYLNFTEIDVESESRETPQNLSTSVEFVAIHVKCW